MPAPEEVTQKRERAAAVKERPVQAAAVAPPRPGSVNQNRPAAAAAVLQPVNGGACLIQTATYGGSATILIRQDTAARTEYTALTVLDGFEDSMTDSYIRARAPGGRSIGGFPDQVSALTRARELCPPAATGSARGQEANAR